MKMRFKRFLSGFMAVEVYAAEDIYTADFQKDDNGNRILEYASGELVGTVTTDKDGKAQMKQKDITGHGIRLMKRNMPGRSFS